MVPFAMPGSLTLADVEKIAALASLELDPTELDLFARQLGGILAYADQVRQVDTTGVAPTAYLAPRREADRPDAVAPSLDASEALANAPDAAREAGLFKVPRVLG